MQRPRVNAPAGANAPSYPAVGPCCRAALISATHQPTHYYIQALIFTLHHATSPIPPTCSNLPPFAANCTQSHLVGLTCVSAQISSHLVAPNRPGSQAIALSAAAPSGAQLAASCSKLQPLAAKDPAFPFHPSRPARRGESRRENSPNKNSRIEPMNPCVSFHLPRHTRLAVGRCCVAAQIFLVCAQRSRAGERRCLSRWGWGVHGEGRLLSLHPVAPTCTSCSQLQQLQRIAASCSKLQPLAAKHPARPFRPSRPARRGESRREGRLLSLHPVAPTCSSCSQLQRIAAVAANYSHLQQRSRRPLSIPLAPPSGERAGERGASYLCIPLHLLAANCSDLQQLQQIAATCSKGPSAPFPSLSPRPAGREPERGAPPIVASRRTQLQQLQRIAAAYTSIFLRFLRYLGVKFLHPLAASCSKLQHVAPNPGNTPPATRPKAYPLPPTIALPKSSARRTVLRRIGRCRIERMMHI
jgi:hypothetical protein